MENSGAHFLLAPTTLAKNSISAYRFNGFGDPWAIARTWRIMRMYTTGSVDNIQDTSFMYPFAQFIYLWIISNYMYELCSLKTTVFENLWHGTFMTKDDCCFSLFCSQVVITRVRCLTHYFDHAWVFWSYGKRHNLMHNNIIFCWNSC